MQKPRFFKLANGTLVAVAALAAACSSDKGQLDDLDAVQSAEAALQAGNVDNVLHAFDGVDDRITIPNHAAYALGTGNFTLEVTARIGDNGRHLVPLLSTRTSGSNGFYFNLYGDQLLIQLNGTPNYLSATVPGLRDGAYHHFAVTRSGTTVTFYVDGVARGTVTSSRSARSNGPLYIGYDSVDRIALKGDVHSARIWQSARTQAELQSAAAGQSVAPSAALVGYWDTTYTTHKVVYDQSATGNNGHLGGHRTDIDAANPELLVPSRNTLRLASSSSAARMTGDECADILVDGTMETFNVQSNSTLELSVADWFCSDEKFEKLVKSKSDTGLGLTFGDFGFNFKHGQDNSEQLAQRAIFCRDYKHTVSQSQAQSFVAQLASPVIVNAWLQCMLPDDTQNLVHTTTTSSDQSVIAMGVRWNPQPGSTVPPEVISFTVSGATCTGQLAPGAALGYGESSMTCVRSGNSAVFALLQTTQGFVTWDLSGLGQIGTASVTADLTSTSDGFVRRDCVTQVGEPACKWIIARYACSPMLHHIATPPLSSGRFVNASLNCISGACGYSTPAGTGGVGTSTISGRFWTSTAGESYKQRPRVTYQLCGDVHDTITTTTPHTTPTINVFRGKSFAVSLPANATAAILQLQLSDGSSLALNLDQGSQGNVQISAGPANSSLKTYNVTVN